MSIDPKTVQDLAKGASRVTFGNGGVVREVVRQIGNGINSPQVQNGFQKLLESLMRVLFK